MPTFESPKWERQGLARPGEVFEFSENTTVRWLALDIAGNTSRGVARFSIGEQYEFGGFRSPIVSGVNERTAGATVPVKFAITGLSDPADVTDIYSETADCQTRRGRLDGRRLAGRVVLGRHGRPDEPALPGRLEDVEDVEGHV